MATKRNYAFLYLALACFAGIIAVFIVDGYMGVYDTIYITTGEQEQRVDADFWLSRDNFSPTYYISAAAGEKVSFRYEIDNRRFSRYSTSVEVSAWRSGEKILDVTSQPIDIAALGTGELEWVVDTAQLGSTPSEWGEEFSLIIQRGDIERRIILNLYPVTLREPSPTG